jgi:MFS transporter, DHA1 family, multidrug resistance protein
MLGLGIVIPLLPRYAETLGATGIEIGAIFSAFSLSRALLMPVFGRLSDRRGRKWFIVLGLSLYTVLSLAYLAAGSVAGLIAVRTVHGVASAMVIPIAMAYVADLSAVGAEGSHMGTFSISLYLGMGIGPLAGGVISAAAGMAAVFLAMTAFSLVSVAICIAFVPEPGPRPRPARSKRRVLGHPALRAAVFFQLVNAFANGTFMVFVPLVASLAYGLSTAETGLVISVSSLSTSVLQRWSGGLADRYNKTVLIVGGTALIAATLLAIPSLSGFPGLVLAAFAIGIGGGVSLPAVTAIVTIAGRTVGQGAAMGASNTAMGIGMIVAPLLSGLVMDLYGIPQVFYLSGLVCTVALPFFVLIARTGLRSDAAPA